MRKGRQQQVVHICAGKSSTDPTIFVAVCGPLCHHPTIRCTFFIHERKEISVTIPHSYQQRRGYEIHRLIDSFAQTGKRCAGRNHIDTTDSPRTSRTQSCLTTNLSFPRAGTSRRPFASFGDTSVTASRRPRQRITILICFIFGDNDVTNNLRFHVLVRNILNTVKFVFASCKLARHICTTVQWVADLSRLSLVTIANHQVSYSFEI